MQLYNKLYKFEIMAKSERRRSGFYCHMHLISQSPQSFLRPLAVMSLDTMVDSPGIHSDDRGTWGDEEEEKRNRSYRL